MRWLRCLVDISDAIDVGGVRVLVGDASRQGVAQSLRMVRLFSHLGARLQHGVVVLLGRIGQLLLLSRTVAGRLGMVDRSLDDRQKKKNHTARDSQHTCARCLLLASLLHCRRVASALSPRCD